MMNKYLLYLLPFITFIPLLAGQPQDSSVTKTNGSHLQQDFHHFVSTGINLVTAPTDFQSKDWLNVGLVSGGAALLFLTDKNIKKFSQRSRSKFNDAVFSVDKTRLNFPMGLLGAGIYGWGCFKKNDRIRRTGLQSIEAYFYTGLISGLFKFAFGRRRPYAGESHTFFKPLRVMEDRYQSMPSSHSSTSFAVLTVLAKSTDNVCWKSFWYGTAGLISTARIYHNRHWLSDVFAGSVLGYAIGSFIVNSDKKENKIFGLKSRWLVSANGIGLRVYWD